MMRQKVRVLVVDDDDDDLFLTCGYLEGIDNYELIIDKELNYKRAQSKIFENEYDVLIVDYLLGPHTGLELLQECIQRGINKPFILLTGKGDKRIDMEATQTGAYDYLTKPELNTELLERSLRYSLHRYASYMAISESEKRYREIFTKSNDIIFLLDSQFCFTDFNPVINKLLGYNDRELLHMPLLNIFEDERDGRKFLHQLEGHPTGSDIEIKLLTNAGERKTFLASFSKVAAPNDSYLYQCILYDYTNIKKSVEEQLLKEKLETTGRLVRSLAHEIRNPLTNINLAIHQLEDETDEEKKTYTEIVKRNSKRINDLISELMNLSTPSSKKYEQMELNHVVRSALMNAMDRIELKKIGVSENLVERKVFIQGDKEKIETALLNIIINAVEAMETGKGKLEVQTSVSERTARIKIRDNGVGIPPENLSYLFQPYFTQKKNGMGLGLANTHSVIKAHNGSIDVESTLGAGSTFIVNFALADEL